jgi:hypothetical protein
MPSYEPPKQATQYITYVALIDRTSGQVFKVNPTLAAGDVKVSIDGGAEANLTTLPVVTPAGSRRVKVTVSAAEMTGDNIGILFSDVAGAEWNDLYIHLQTSARQIDDIPTTTQIKTEVVNALSVDTYPEPGQNAPAATASLIAKLNYLYKAWRNQTTQDATTYKLYNDDTTTVGQKATTADDGTTFTRGEVGTGP